MSSRSITFSTTEYEYERRRGWETERTVRYHSENVGAPHTSTQGDQMMRAQELSYLPPPKYSSHIGHDGSPSSPGTTTTTRKRSFPALRALATSRSAPTLRTAPFDAPAGPGVMGGGGFSSLFFGRSASNSRGRRRANPPAPLTLSSILLPPRLVPMPSLEISTPDTVRGVSTYHHPPAIRGPAPPLRSDALLDQFPTPPGLPTPPTQAPPYHLIGRNPDSPRPAYTLHSLRGERLPVAAPRRLDSRSPTPAPTARQSPTTPTRTKVLPSTPTASSAPPRSVQPRHSKPKVTSGHDSAVRPRSLEYSSSQGSSYQEPSEALHRSSSGSRRIWLAESDEDWVSEVARASSESDAHDAVEVVAPSFQGHTTPERSKRNALLLTIPVASELAGDGEWSAGDTTPSSRFSDGASVDTHQSLPFHYATDLERRDLSDPRRLTLVSSPTHAYPAQSRSPGIQPLHLPLRTRPVSRAPSSPFPYSYSALNSPRSIATPTSPSPRRTSGGRHSLLVPARPPSPAVRRRPSSASEVEGLEELLYRTRPLSIKRHVGVQSSARTTTVGTQTDSLPRSLYHRPAPLYLDPSPTTPSLSSNPPSGSLSTLATTPTTDFETAHSRRASSTILGDEEADSYADLALAEFFPAVLSPPPVSCRASIVPLRRTGSTVAPSPVTPGFGDKSERGRALEEEVSRLNKVIQILTGGPAA